jgi:DNA-binding HxlR family transcriptional regulator
MEGHRSGCPINLAVEVLGDRWTLLVIRDLAFADRRHFGDLVSQSEEGIATNVLSDRLKRLVDSGLVTRSPNPRHRQKAVYSLTEKAIELVPVLVQLGAWGRRHLPAHGPAAQFNAELEAGGPPMWDAVMADLRARHLAA